MLEKLDRKSYNLSDKTLNLINKNQNYKCNFIIAECNGYINIMYENISNSSYDLDFICAFNTIEANILLNPNFESNINFYAHLLELYRHELHHIYQHLHEEHSINESELDLFRLYEVDAYLYGLNLKAEYLNEHLIEIVERYIDNYQFETQGFDRNIIKEFWLNRAESLQLL